MTTVVCHLDTTNNLYFLNSDLILLLEDQPNEKSQFGKLKTFFRSCLDKESIRKRSFQPSVDFILNTFGHYLNPNQNDDGDLTDVVQCRLFYMKIEHFAFTFKV